MRRRDLLAALAAASLAGPARAAGSPVYRRGNGADPETLDPHKTSTLAEATILLDLFEGLTCYDAAAIWWRERRNAGPLRLTG